jgi:hypothetical protein
VEDEFGSLQLHDVLVAQAVSFVVPDLGDDEIRRRVRSILPSASEIDLMGELARSAGGQSLFDQSSPIFLETLRVSAKKVGDLNRSFASDRSKQAWWTRSLLEPLRSGSRSFLFTHRGCLGHCAAWEGQLLLGCLLTSASFDAYFGKLPKEGTRIVLPPFRCKVSTGDSPVLPLGIGPDSLVLTTVYLWPGRKAPAGARGRLATVSMVVLSLDNRSFNWTPKDAIRRAQLLEGSAFVTLGDPIDFLGLSAGAEVEVANLASFIGRRLQETLGGVQKSMKIEGDEGEFNQSHGVRLVVLDALTYDGSRIHVPDFKTKEAKDFEECSRPVGAMIRLLGLLTWSINSSGVPKGRYSPKSERQIATDLARFQSIYWRDDRIDFTNPYFRRVISTSNRDENFPGASKIWLLVRGILAIENVSAQVTVLRLLNREAQPGSVPSRPYEQVQRVADELLLLDSFQNFEAVEVYFRHKVDGIRSLLHIDRDLAAARLRVENLTSSALKERDSQISRSIERLTVYLVSATVFVGLAGFFLTYALGSPVGLANIWFDAAIALSVGASVTFAAVVVDRLRRI